MLPLRAPGTPGERLPVAALKNLDETLDTLLRVIALRRWQREEQAFQQLRDDTLSSGAMPGEFTLVAVFRRGQLLKPEIR